MDNKDMPVSLAGFARVDAELEAVKAELKRTQNVLGTLITWLPRELGEQGIKDLLKQLEGES